MFGLTTPDLIVIVLYIGLMIWIGYWSMKRIKNQEDFFMGGRSFGKLLQVMAMFGSGTSTDSPVGTARNTFIGGLSGIWTVLNYLFATPFYWFIGLWYRRYRMMTMADFFEERYQSRAMASMYAIFGLFFFIVWLSVGFSAASKTIVALTPKSAQELSVAERQETAQFQRMKELENQDYRLLESREQAELQELRALHPRGLFSFLSGPELIIFIGAVVLLYSWAGGLVAAYFTDLVQGFFIILLSFILIPFGLLRIAERFGGGGMMDGFRIMHQQLPEEFFDILGSPYASDFTWYYLLAVTMINLVGIVVQPHMIVFGGGSAKDELSARVGILAGNLHQALPDHLLGPGRADRPGAVRRGAVGPGPGLGPCHDRTAAAAGTGAGRADDHLADGGPDVQRQRLHPGSLEPAGAQPLQVHQARCQRGALRAGGPACQRGSDCRRGVLLDLLLRCFRPAQGGLGAAGDFRRDGLGGDVLEEGDPDRGLGEHPHHRRAVLHHPDPAAGGQSRPAHQREIPGDDRNPGGGAQLRGQGVRCPGAAAPARGLAGAGPPGTGRLGSSGAATLGDTIHVATKPPSKSIYWTTGVRLQADGSMLGTGFFNVEFALLDWLGSTCAASPIRWSRPCACRSGSSCRSC